MDWVLQISDSLNDVLDTARPPFQNIPALPLYAESTMRPGLSADVLASKIISRLPDIGIPTGPNPDGSKNVINDLIKVMCEEIVEAIKNDSLVLMTIPSGAIKITSTGGNVGGPVQSTGQNWNFSEIKGIVQ